MSDTHTDDDGYVPRDYRAEYDKLVQQILKTDKLLAADVTERDIRTEVSRLYGVLDDVQSTELFRLETVDALRAHKTLAGQHKVSEELVASLQAQAAVLTAERNTARAERDTLHEVQGKLLREVKAQRMSISAHEYTIQSRNNTITTLTRKNEALGDAIDYVYGELQIDDELTDVPHLVQLKLNKRKSRARTNSTPAVTTAERKIYRADLGKFKQPPPSALSHLQSPERLAYVIARYQEMVAPDLPPSERANANKSLRAGIAQLLKGGGHRQVVNLCPPNGITLSMSIDATPQRREAILSAARAALLPLIDRQLFDSIMPFLDNAEDRAQIEQRYSEIHAPKKAVTRGKRKRT